MSGGANVLHSSSCGSLVTRSVSIARIQQQCVWSLCRQTVIVKRLLDGYSKQDPPDRGT